MRKEMLLRIEEDLYEEIKKVADSQERSVNAQILYILKKYLEGLTNEKNDSKYN